MAYQSLYRRYRPRRFSEVKGQEHVVKALRNAVRDNRVGHAYLFSGPRGCGKTTTARILAKVLNCPNAADGEPCCECQSCLAVEAGTSFDVHELDAASNRKIEDIRSLLEKVHYGTPGRMKVYILDEVHQLTPDAVSALLKTLEEPPDDVVFVLATTDPQKVLPTIRSRCQQFEFRLLPNDDLDAHVRWVAHDAGIDVTDDAVEAVLRLGAGSARDTLSALERIAAGGGVAEEDGDQVSVLVEALIHQDTAAALAAVVQATDAGRDARSIADRLIETLRNAFLALMAPNLLRVTDREAARITDQAHRLGPAGTVRAMEVLGAALVEFRHVPEPRLLLDIALVRLTNPNADTSNDALLARIEKLERRLAAGGTAGPVDGPAAGARPAGGPPAGEPVAPVSGRAALGQARARSGPAPAGPAPAPAPPRPTPAPTAASAPAPTGPTTSPASSATGPLPSRDELTLSWADHVLPRLKGLAKPLYSAGRFLDNRAQAAVLAFPSDAHRERCEAHRTDVEAVLAAHFGRPVPLVLVVDDGATTAPRAGRPAGTLGSAATSSAPATGPSPAPGSASGTAPLRPAPRPSGPAPVARPAPTAPPARPVITPPAFDDEAIDPDELVDAPPGRTDIVDVFRQHFGDGIEVIDEDR